MRIEPKKPGPGTAVFVLGAVAVFMGLLAWFRPSPADAAGGSAAGDPGEPAGPQLLGRRIFQADCAVCHGTEGAGTFRGPPIDESGTAAVDFMVRTGRMPPPPGQFDEHRWWSPASTMKRGEPAYTPLEIDALVAYTEGFVEGPEVPTEVDTDGADLSAGAELYRLNCAACHQMAGQGGALAYGVTVPGLHRATPTEVVEAVRTGPGSMPAFAPGVLSEDQVVEVTAYVEHLDEPDDPGGLALWHLGPVPEGMVAWFVGAGMLLVLARWLGQRSPSDGSG